MNVRTLIRIVVICSVCTSQVTSAKEVFAPDFVHFGNMGGLMPTLTLADLPSPESAQAKLLFSACSQCHNAPGPGMHTEEEWDQVFWKMYWRMQVMRSNNTNFLVPEYDQAHKLLGYLKAYAIKPFKEYRGKYIDTSSEPFRLFQSICTQCHTLPDPRQHTAEEWPTIVNKMKQNIVSMVKVRTTDTNMQKIMTFLQEHAGEASETTEGR